MTLGDNSDPRLIPPRRPPELPPSAGGSLPVWLAMLLILLVGLVPLAGLWMAHLLRTH